MKSKYYKFRSEMQIVASRMQMYENREKWESVLSKQEKAGQRVNKILVDGIKPRVLTLEIIYPEIDLAQPIEDEDEIDFDLPGITLREVSVTTGQSLRYFTLSFDEAKKLAALLSHL